MRLAIYLPLLGVFCIMFLASSCIAAYIVYPIYRFLRDLFLPIGRLYRQQIIEPWRNHKSVRAFHGREPRPPSRSSAREVSEGRIADQRNSMLLKKLPLEIRLCIYEMVILDGSTHWHITEYRNTSGDRPPSKRARNSLWLFRSNVARMRQASVASQLCLASEIYHLLTPHEVDRELLRCGYHVPGQNNLGIIRTCRQIYCETTPILYGQYRSSCITTYKLKTCVGQPIICFGILGRPPYFIYNSVPQRLAQIRHVQLDYVQTDGHKHGKRCSRSGPYALRCTNCNFCHWLKLIKLSMTGLRTLDIFMTFSLDGPLPEELSLFENTWMDALFDLQRNFKAVREFSVSTEHGNTASNREAQRVRKFEKMIQRRLSELKQTVVVSSEKLEV